MKQPKKSTKNKGSRVRYSQEDIERHGGEKELQKALLSTRDLNPEELQKITAKACKKITDEALTNSAALK